MVVKRKIKKVLIANRGEVALRILRTVKELELGSVVVYEWPDKEAHYIRLADEAVMIGGGPRKDYLDIDKMIWAAKTTGADAIHPGYGFLAENADFCEACRREGLVFIGPPPGIMRVLVNKVSARDLIEKTGISCIPGTDVLSPGDEGYQEALAFGRRCGYPIIIKALRGGGGRGIRTVESEEDLIVCLKRARSEARSSFHDDRVYVEKYIKDTRHVEIQILADQYGKIIHLGSRDCSIQRRHQKLLETAPADLPANVLKELEEAAMLVAEETGYVSAGTVEFLVDPATHKFWFIAMNTRLQVEHTVTEELTNVDIVREQIRIAEGEPLQIVQDDIRLLGNAIQVRINAEDPQNNFMPEGGKMVELYLPPGGPGIRLDGILYQGYKIPTEYDSLLIKMTVRGYDWQQTVDRLKKALDIFMIDGLKTTLPFYRSICNEPDFRSGNIDTGYIGKHTDIFNYPEPAKEILKLKAFLMEIYTQEISPYDWL
jgi:pyruvate carboxylase subunit A